MVSSELGRPLQGAGRGAPARFTDDWLQVVRLPHCVFCGFASRKSFTIGTMTFMRCISVTCVVCGNMANLDSERGRMSPKISPPFKRNISAMWSSRTPSASP